MKVISTALARKVILHAESARKQGDKMTNNPLDIQSKFRELGRIRMGQVVATSRGGTRPSKLDTFRLTSADEDLIQSAADMWGGTPRLWEGAPGGSRQWEVVLEKKSIEVLVPPIAEAQSLTCEKWAFGLGQWRCDGTSAQQPDESGEWQPQACNQWCQERAADAPKMVFRANFMLPDLAGLGLWRLETHSYNAVRELRPTMQMLMRMGTHSDRAIPAFLKLEQRSERKQGKAGNKPQTFNYSVPVLDPGVPIGELMQMPGAMSAMALAESEKNQEPPVMLLAARDSRPVEPEIPEAPQAPVSIPESTSPPSVESAIPLDDHWVATDPATSDDIKHVAIICRKLYGADADAERHRLAWTVSGERTESSKELSRGEIGEVKATLKTEAMDEAKKITSNFFKSPTEAFEYLAEENNETFGDWSPKKNDPENPTNWPAGKWADAVQVLRGKQAIEESLLVEAATASGGTIIEVQDNEEITTEELPW